MTTPLKLLAAATLFAVTSLAQAGPISIFSHTINNPDRGSFDGVNPRGGDVKSIRTTYNETAQTFAWSYTVAPSIDSNPNKNGSENNGFWLVVSDGPDPKYDEDEYAILFGDLNTNRLTAYLYSGRNNSESWNDPGILLASYDAGAIEVAPGAPGSDTKTVSFDIDVSGINSYSAAGGWDGISFGEQIGIWFHPTVNTRVSYDGAEITAFSGRGGYYDGKEIKVRQVPEPKVLYLAGLGLLAFFLSRKLTGNCRRSAPLQNGPSAQIALVA